VAGAALGARYDFFGVASAAFSAAKDHFAWQAQHLKHVMIKKWKPAIVTCFARLKKFKYIILSARGGRYDCVRACGAVTILDRNVVSRCGAVRIL